MTHNVELKGLEGYSPTSSLRIREGPFSNILQETWVSRDKSQEAYVVLKVAATRRKFSKEPHDIVKELRIVRRLSHVNVIDVLGQDFTGNASSLVIYMPYVPYALSGLLASPSFSPHLPDSTSSQFGLLAKSLMFQIIAAFKYLHSEGVAHRDVKPDNVLIDDKGYIKLIDFGISWDDPNRVLPSEKRDDLWPESPETMYFEVSTGPYRAPELLFGPKTYDAFATDLWSLGATFAEFFTPLAKDDYTGDHNHALLWTQPTTSRWTRKTLFDAAPTEIGLAWSIFRTRGTPTDEVWPTFKDLPHASTLMFHDAPLVDLPSLLPNLPREVPTGTTSATRSGEGLETSRHHPHFPPKGMTPSPLDLLHRLLVYPPSQRLMASEALQHPWFRAEPLVLLPTGYPFEDTSLDHPSLQVWEGKNLGKLLIPIFNFNKA